MMILNGSLTAFVVYLLLWVYLNRQRYCRVCRVALKCEAAYCHRCGLPTKGKTALSVVRELESTGPVTFSWPVDRIEVAVDRKQAK